MINLSIKDTPANILAAIAKLPPSSDNVDAPTTAAAVVAANLMVNNCKQPQASLNFRVNSIGNFQQIEIQLFGQNPPKPPATPIATQVEKPA